VLHQTLSSGFLLAALLFSTATGSLAQSVPRFSTSTITDQGAWCWFADPRAITYKNRSGTIHSSYIGYIDVHGNIKATQIDRLTSTVSEVLIRSWFQPDDHNNPTFLVLPDERVMVFYSRHTDEPCFYYRISQKPGDITTLGREVRLETTHNTTYPSPFILSDDPDHIYLCWRGVSWHPTIAKLTMPDANDEVKFVEGPFQIMRSMKGGRGVRPYAKYVSDSKSRIYIAYTTTHPDNQPTNYIYLNYVDINNRTLHDMKGKQLATIGTGTLHDVESTETYRSTYPDAVVEATPFRNWLWEVALDEQQYPVIAMVQISDDKASHNYYHVRWTGIRWQKTFLANAGGHFHQSPDIEKCYSGGMAIDRTNPGIIYGSVPVKGQHGEVYELKKFTVTPDGRLAATEQLTFNSPKNNVRPFVLGQNGQQTELLWMCGHYYDWMVSAARPNGYPTAIRTNIALSARGFDPANGLLLQKSGVRLSPSGTTLQTRATDAFTVALSVALAPDAVCGELMKFGDVSVGITCDGHPRLYVQTPAGQHVSDNVLGSSDVWKTMPRGTNGAWYPPAKLNLFQLAVSYHGGMLRICINGLIDQTVALPGLSLSGLMLGGVKGTASDVRIYNRALTQYEMQQVMQTPDA
jgi:hypothetical protein